jgi:hypothetical protein
MSSHIYSIGQRVSFDKRAGPYPARSGVYSIIKLLPPVGVELQYRIKSDAEAYERVASEHELRAVALAGPSLAAGSRSPTDNAEASRVFDRLT